MESCGLGMIFLRLFDLTLFYIIYIIGRNKNETMETAPVSFLCGLHCSFLFGWLCVLFRQLRKIFYGCILFCLHDFIFSFLSNGINPIKKSQGKEALTKRASFLR